MSESIPPLLRRIATAVLWIGAFGVLTNLVVHHMVTMPVGKGGNDSFIYLRAASNFISHPDQLYDDAHHQVMGSWSAIAFVHPPSGLLPYLPFAPVLRLANVQVAASVWSVFDTGALFAAVILAGRKLGMTWLTLGAATLLIAINDPTSSEIAQGQVNAIVLLLVVLSFVRWPHLDSGLFMGLALSVKPVSAIILIIPLLRRRPAITVAALVTVAALNIPFIPLIGISSTVFYLTTVLPFFAGHVLRNGSNVALPFVLQKWFGGVLSGNAPFGTPVPRTIDGQVILWVTRLVVAVLWIRAAIDRRLDTAIVFALALGTVPFFSSTIWPHYLVFMYPLALATLVAPRLWVRAVGALALVAMLWSGRGDALWVSIVLLWVAAAGLVIGQLGWRLPAGRWKPEPARA